ncbi:AI-2E family transporter [Sphingomonas histidinilytica]|uniref:AI-2E family transporter n=1 Tax=Rhizorhabdus histidinilytica TaxID=439228 RepID=UPI001ADC8000|nr:AI-2E family transporter [Rhizorhabdus histidinilytica]MBO9378739.1 AI-2E family transporter [Rhizorhabdus histidinilytica]
MRRIEDTSFTVLILAVSLAFAWVVQPLFGAILWGVIASILFAPLNDRLLLAMPRRNNLAALLTLLAIMAMVILPAILLSAFLLQELAGVYARMQSGDVDPGAYFLQFQERLPRWLKSLLTGLGLTDFEAVRARLTAGIAASFQTLTARALSIGQSAFGFVIGLGVMLYLSFFLLRDGKQVAARVEAAIPLDPEQRAALFAKFTAVIRATIKGSLVVAVIQGAIGGIVFWILGIHSALLWGVLMAFLSLLPAIGTGIVWVPVAVYLLVTGAVWEGIILILCGLFIIGLVDNLLRPILVGRDARMPDYVVLISTLGGLEVLGFNGLVIGPVTAALFIAAWDIFARSRLKPQAEPT